MSEWEFPRIELAVALVTGVCLIGGSFVLANYTQVHESLFDLTPTVPEGVTIPDLDIISKDKTYVFHATIYTVWATMLLSLPAFCLVCFIRTSRIAASYWLVFWTMGVVAMWVHLYMSMGVLFNWNWQHILEDTVRVTIPKPDLVLTAWWTIDVVLAWMLRHSRGIVLHAQRLILHVSLFAIFLIGFIREGETLLSNAIGLVSALAVMVALTTGMLKRQSTGIANTSID